MRDVINRRLLLSCWLLLPCFLIHTQHSFGQPNVGQPTEPNELTYEEKASALQEQVKQSVDQMQELEVRRDKHSGTTATVFEQRIEAASLEALAKAHRLAQLVIDREAGDADPGPAGKATRQLLRQIPERVKERLDELLGSDDLDQKISDLNAAEQVALEADREELTERVLALHEALLRNLELSEQLGLKTDGQIKFLEQALADTAANQSVALELAGKYENTVARQARVLPQDSELTALLGVAAGRTARHNEALRHLVEMMDKRGMRVVEYRQQLVKTTGTVTTDIFDLEVFSGLLRGWLRGSGIWVTENLPAVLFNFLIFVLIVWAAATLARISRRLVDRGLNRAPATLSELLRRMIISIIGNLVLLLGLLFGLAQLGISVGPLLAGLGIAGFIIGFALQDTLGNFASGMMILLYRPYDVGDFIETNGVLGKVSGMSLVNTTILTFDNQTLVLPNGKIWGDVIKNVTAQSERRVDMVFGIGYADDIEKAERVFEDIVFNHSRVLKEPAPVIRLHTLNESSVDFIVRPWALTEDYWDVYWDITRAVKQRFDAEGISIPFPQRDIHLFSSKKVTQAIAATAALEQPHVATRPGDEPPDDEAPDD